MRKKVEGGEEEQARRDGEAAEEATALA